MPLNSAPNNPLDICIRSTFAGQLKTKHFFYCLALLLETSCLKHKRAAPRHMYLDAPFHSNQAAAEERTYREADGPAPNTRHNSLEGLGVKERDGMSELQINTTKPCWKYCNTHHSHKHFLTNWKGKDSGTFFFLLQWQSSNWISYGDDDDSLKCNFLPPQQPTDAASIRIHHKSKRIFFPYVQPLVCPIAKEHLGWDNGRKMACIQLFKETRKQMCPKTLACSTRQSDCRKGNSHAEIKQRRKG